MIQAFRDAFVCETRSWFLFFIILGVLMSTSIYFLPASSHRDWIVDDLFFGFLLPVNISSSLSSLSTEVSSGSVPETVIGLFCNVKYIQLVHNGTTYIHLQLQLVRIRNSYIPLEDAAYPPVSCLNVYLTFDPTWLLEGSLS